MFLEKLFKLEEVPSNLDFKSNYMYNGAKVPRVTEILSKTIHNDALMYWANSLGFKRKSYKHTLDEAASIGTTAHLNIEEYLKDDTYDSDNVPLLGFIEWWETINKYNDIKILGQEESLSCKWFGGTYDLLLSINGYPYLVDFKTSNHIRYNYFLQLAAYSVLLYQNKNIVPKGFIILQLDKYDPSYNEFALLHDDIQTNMFMEQCTNAFWSLVTSYYHTLSIEKEYNKIYNERWKNEKS